METNKKNKDAGKSDSVKKPDPETLHKTDPQDNMEGPVSSVMQNIREEAEENEEEDKKDKAKKEHD